MAEIDGSRAFQITAEALWAVVADPARLADWVPTMRRAQPSGKEEVHVEGESHGHRYSLDSELRIDEGDRRLDWGAEGTTATVAPCGSPNGRRAPQSIFMSSSRMTGWARSRTAPPPRSGGAWKRRSTAWPG